MNNYADIADFKRHSNMPLEDTTRDEMIQEALDAAAATWERICGRQFLADTVASAQVFNSGQREYCYTREFVAVTAVETYSNATWTALAAGTWEAFSGDALDPVYHRLPYHGVLLTGTGVFSKKVRVTAKWGYGTTAPTQFLTAVVAQAHIWYKAAEASWSEATASTGFGQLFYKMSVDHHLKLMLIEAKLVRPQI